MDRSRLLGTIAWLALVGAALAADPLPPAHLSGESLPTARRLAEAAKHAEKEKWTEAVEEYQRILEEAGDELVPLDVRKREHCLQVRRLVAMQLARYPALLRLYRSRVDDQAKKWLDQGIADRDPVLLRRLVDRAFCSRHTERAIDLLGDLAFEHGDTAEAEQWWRLIARPASEAKDKSSLALVFPDPQIDLALVRAKLILSRLLRGDRTAALTDLKAFQAAHGKATGLLAGRKGNLAQILQEAARNADSLMATETNWPTLAGAGSRSVVLPKAPRCRWLDAPWRVRLDGDQAVIPSRTPAQQAQACVFQPAIAGDLVLVADDRSVTAYDLFTGRQRGHWELPGERPNRWDAKTAQQLGVRYTLSVAGNRAYVRLGTPIQRPTREGRGDVAKTAVTESYLVCLALPPSREGKFSVCWEVKARTGEVPTAFFEGSPLVHDNRVYIGRTYAGNDGRATTAIDCYHAETGALHWRQEVCAAREAGTGPRCRYHLLTRAGPNVVYCSHSGAVVAVDAASGKRVWGVRYPSRGNRLADGTLSQRDLLPAVHADGRLFIAPADLDHILCLDAATGQTLWESNALEVAQLIGVARGRLIFTSASAPAGIRAVEAATGKDLRGWMQPNGDSNGLPTVGRGLLAGDWVFWPTANGLRILTQQDGEPAADAFLPLNNSIQGNLAVGQGCLIAATDRELLGYVPESAFLAPRRKDAAADPDNAHKRFRLGLAQASAGLPEAAVQEFAGAEKRAFSADFRRQIQRERHAALLQWAEREQSAETFRRAAAEEFPVPLRLRALARLADFQIRNGKSEGAIAVWQSILGDPGLRSGTVVDSKGIPCPAASHAFRMIGGLIATHGPEVYAPFEAKAKALPTDGQDAKAAQARARLIAEFPNASITPALLRHRAEQCEQSGDHAAAARFYRRLLRYSAARVQALEALARHYQRQKNPTGPPELTVPLRQAWQVSFAADKPERLLSSSSERVFSVGDDGTLICRDSGTGKELWKSAASGRRSTWVACQGDLVIAAGPDKVVAYSDGIPLWSFTGEGLDSFQFVASRLFFLQNDRRLWALDAETGDVLWTLWAPGAPVGVSPPRGQFHHFAAVGPDRVIVQPSQGKAWLVDGRTGQNVRDLDADGDPWQQAPVVLDEKRALLQPNPQHLALFDISSGKEIWRHTVERPVSLTGEPLQVMAAGDGFLAILPRNQGYELIRINAATGKSSWPKPFNLGVDRPELDGAVFDRETLYLPVAGTLHAIALSSARRLWTCPLGGQRWRVRLARNYLLVHPREAESEMPLGAALRRYWPAAPGPLFPTGAALAGLPGVLTLLSCIQAPSRFSLILCDPRNGRVVQRLNLVSRGLHARVSLGEQGAVIGLPTRIWSFR